jgi:PAS domain S-box-containing protein
MATVQHKADLPANKKAYRTVLDLVRLGTVGKSDHDRAISDILQCVKTYFDLPRVAVCLMDPGSYTVKCLIDDIGAHHIGAHHIGDVMPLAGSWCEQVARLERSVLAVCESARDFAAYPGLLDHSEKTYAGARIMVEGRLYGIMNVTAPTARAVAFDDGDREVLEVAAALVGHRLSLQSTEERLELVLRGSSVGFWEWDIRADAIFWSPRYLEILGLPGGVVDRTFADFVNRQHPDDRAHIRQAMRDHLEHRLPYDIEFRLSRENGEYAWMHARGQASWDVSGAPRRMAGSIDDITARKLADQALQQSKQRYSLAVRGTGVGIWDWDVATGQVFWSDQLLRMFGSDEGDSRQSVESFGDRIHEEDRAAVLALRQRHLAGEADYRIEYRACLPTGETIWVHTRGQAIWNEAGEPVRMAGSCHDITSRKTAELQVQQQAEELGRTNRELEQFAAVAAHDLQEPLRKITSFGALLTRDYSDRLDARGHMLVDRMVDGAHRLRQLIQDLLGYSRSSNDAMRIEKIALQPLIADVCSDFELLISETGAVIECDSDAVLRGDPVLLRQMFQNLLSNSLKYRGEAAPLIQISARLTEDGSNWHLAVRDNGIGFASRHAKRVFEIFKRLHSRDAYPGTGIGLALCQRVVERHGGQIWAQSEPGEGTSILIDWPVSPKTGLAVARAEPSGSDDGKV